MSAPPLRGRRLLDVLAAVAQGAHDLTDPVTGKFSSSDVEIVKTQIARNWSEQPAAIQQSARLAIQALIRIGDRESETMFEAGFRAAAVDLKLTGRRLSELLEVEA